MTLGAGTRLGPYEISFNRTLSDLYLVEGVR